MGGLFSKKKGEGSRKSRSSKLKLDKDEDSKKNMDSEKSISPSPTSEPPSPLQPTLSQERLKGKEKEKEREKEKENIGGERAHDEDGDNEDDIQGPAVLFTQNSQKVSSDDFELLTVIGKGSFGKVMQVRKKDDGKIYAMKVLRKEAIILKKQVIHTKAERNILQKIQHPFIVKLHYAFQTEDKLYMILDYINGGELFFHLKKEGRFSEDRVRFYAAEIASAIGHLHQLNIVYRDLKPENLLLDSEGHIVITDFGLSKEVTDDKATTTFCGTPEYIAPEMLKGQGHGKSVDWWSLGTLMFEMLSGLPPFYAQNVNVMYTKILNAELRFPPYITGDTKSVLEAMLTRDPQKRLGGGPDDFKELMRHPYFSAIDWDQLIQRQAPPVFKPAVAGEFDTTQIDPVFTQETAIDSVVDRALPTEILGDNHFENFTYQDDNALI